MKDYQVATIVKIKESKFKSGFIHSLKEKIEKGIVLSDQEISAAERAFKKYEIYQENPVQDDFPKSVEEMRRIRAERLKKFKEKDSK